MIRLQSSLYKEHLYREFKNLKLVDLQVELQDPNFVDLDTQNTTGIVLYKKIITY